MTQDCEVGLKARADVKAASVHCSHRLQRGDWLLCTLQRQPQTFFFSSAFLKLLPFFPHANESADDREKRQVTRPKQLRS